MASTEPQAKITLHWLELSRAQRILWLLEELKVPYELKTYKRTKERLAPPELKQIHPLGKSPLLTIEAPGNSEPIVLAESAAIVEYLCDYYGSSLVPKRYKESQEGKIGGETESWLRYRYFMHYAEGSFFPFLLVSLLFNIIRESSPFFIKPITNGLTDRITTMFLKPNFESGYRFLESQLETAPDGGGYLCGNHLTAADVLMVFPLEVGESRSGMKKEDFPRIYEYIGRLHQIDSYKRAIQKIVEVEGKFKTNL